MKRLLLAAAALLCVFAAGCPADAQMTTVTATNLALSGQPIANGTATFTAVDGTGQPISFTGGNGAFNLAGAFSCTITAGALSGCQVPDACLTTPANILYTVQISSAGHAYFLAKTPGICGATYTLGSVSTAVALVATLVATAPSGTCTMPALDISTTPPNAFMCIGTTWVPIIGAGAVTFSGSYNAGTSYSQYALVSAGGYTYISNLNGNLGNTPATSPTQWTPLGTVGPAGPPGVPGAAANFTIGTVAALAAGATPTVTIGGTAPNYVLNLGIPVGQAGTNGAPGATPTFTIGTVTGLAYGFAPTASLGGTAPNYLLNLGIPAGAAGANGTPGTNGTNGANGATPILTVGTVTQLAAGSTPTFTITGTAPNYTVNIGIPAGAAGANGTPGTNGTNGTNGATPVLSVGTVTQLAAGSTPTFTITGTAPNYTVNIGIPAGATGPAGPLSYTAISSQSAATYAITSSDCNQQGSEVQFTSSTGTAITLPTTGVTAGCVVRIKNLVAGQTLAITPASGTIDQDASLNISYPGDGEFFFTGATTGITWLGFGGYGVRGASALTTLYAAPYVSNIGRLGQVAINGLAKYGPTGPPTAALPGTDYEPDYMRERGMSSAPTLPMSEEGIGAVPYTYGAAIGLRYFVDACLGSDSNDGRSEVFPWKTLAHVGVTPAIFGPDTTVLLHDNCVFHDELLLGNNVTATGSTTLTSNPPAFSGTPGHPVVITSYGPQGPALIDGSDAIVATWTAVSGQTTVFQATLPSVATTNVAYASGTFTVTLPAARTYIQNSEVSLVNCTNADFDGTGAIITSTTGNIRPSNVFTITGIAAPAESSSLGCGVVFMPRKLYVDQGDAANPEFPLQTQPLTAEHNYAGCWAASTKYNFLDSVSSCAATPVFSLYLEQESGSDASIAAGPTITPFNQAAVSDTNTGLQNVIANSGSWYASGSTIYVHLATGDNPGGHTIEGVQRVFGVALLSVNDVTVDGIAVERTQGPAIASGVFTNPTLAGAYTTGNDITIQNSIVVNYSDSGFPNVWQQGGAGTKLFGAGSAGINGGILIAGYQASCLCAPQIQNPTILNNSVGQFDDPWAFSSFQKVGVGLFGFNNGTISGNFVATTFDTAISSTYANSPGNTGLTMAYNYTTNSNINYSIAATQNAVFHHNRALSSSGEGLQTGGAVISQSTPANGFPAGTEWCDTNILAYDNVMAYLAPSLGNGEGLNGFDNAGGVTGTFANNTFYHVDANAITLEYNASTAGCPGTPHSGESVRVTGNVFDQSGMANAGNVLLRDESILDGSTFDHNDYLTDTQNTGNAMYVNTGLGATLGANYTIAAFIATYDTTGISVMPHFRSPSNGDFTPEPGSGLGGHAVAITGVPNPTLDIGAVAVPLAQPTVRSHPYPVQHMQTGGACEAGEGYDLDNGQHVSCDNGAFFNWMAYALSHSTGGTSGGTSSTPQGTANQIDVANPGSSTPTFSLDANLTPPGSITIGPGLGITANPTTNYSSLLSSLCGAYENSSLNSVLDCVTMNNVIGTGSTPTWTMTFGHTGSTGAGLFSFGSYALSAGAITGTSLNLPAIGAATSSVNQNSQQMIFNASQWQAGAPVASGAYFQLQPAAGGTNVSVANVLALTGTGTFAGLSLKVPLLTVSGMITAGGLVTSGQIYDASGGGYLKIIPGSASASTVYQRAISDSYTAVTFLNAASGSTGAIADFCYVAGSCYMRVGQKGNIAFAEGAAVASATTIAPTGAIFHVTGTTPIATISLPQGMSSTLVGSITIIADAAWTTTTAGNISSAITATAGTAYIFTYDGTNSKWYIK